jgi:hypothetical protein
MGCLLMGLVFHINIIVSGWMGLQLLDGGFRVQDSGILSFSTLTSTSTFLKGFREISD